MGRRPRDGGRSRTGRGRGEAWSARTGRGGWTPVRSGPRSSRCGGLILGERWSAAIDIHLHQGSGDFRFGESVAAKDPGLARQRDIPRALGNGLDIVTGGLVAFIPCVRRSLRQERHEPWRRRSNACRVVNASPPIVMARTMSARWEDGVAAIAANVEAGPQLPGAVANGSDRGIAEIDMQAVTTGRAGDRSREWPVPILERIN